MFPRAIQLRGQQFILPLYFGTNFTFNLMHHPIFIDNRLSPWKLNIPNVLENYVLFIFLLFLFKKIEIHIFSSKGGEKGLGFLG
jgi:hypothetical protein